MLLSGLGEEQGFAAAASAAAAAAATAAAAASRGSWLQEEDELGLVGAGRLPGRSPGRLGRQGPQALPRRSGRWHPYPRWVRSLPQGRSARSRLLPRSGRAWEQ